MNKLRVSLCVVFLACNGAGHASHGVMMDDLDDLGPLEEISSGEDLGERRAQVIQTHPRERTAIENGVLEHIYGKNWQDTGEREPSGKLPLYLFLYLEAISSIGPTSNGDLFRAIPEEYRPADKSPITRFLQKYIKLGWVSRESGRILLTATGQFAYTELCKHDGKLRAQCKKRTRDEDDEQNEQADKVLRGLRTPAAYAALLEFIGSRGAPLTLEQIKTEMWGKKEGTTGIEQLVSTAMKKGWLELVQDTYVISEDGLRALPILRQSGEEKGQQPKAEKKARVVKIVEANLKTLRNKEVYLDLLDLMNGQEFQTCHEYLERMGDKRKRYTVKDETFATDYFPKLVKFGWVTMVKRGRHSTYAITELGSAKREELRGMVAALRVAK